MKPFKVVMPASFKMDFGSPDQFDDGGKQDIEFCEWSINMLIGKHELTYLFYNVYSLLFVSWMHVHLLFSLSERVI